MQVRIYQPAKTTMQSGRAKTRSWMLEYELEAPRRVEPLMGWTSAGDTLNQVHLCFPTQEEAVRFAEHNGWSVQIVTPNARKLRPRNYADNFKPDRIR